MTSNIQKYNVDNLLDMFDQNTSDLEGFESESSSNEFDGRKSSDDDDAGEDDANYENEGETGEFELDDDCPLSHLIAGKQKWSTRKFVPPEDIEFLGDTALPELPKDEHREVSPYKLLKMFITDTMLESVEQTNKYSVDKTGSSINTTVQEIEQLIGVIYYMGLVHMPNLRSYWENEICFERASNVIARNRFLKLLTLLHFVNNYTVTDEEQKDKLWKLRPWFESLRTNFLQIPLKEFQSIDEIIVPFKGRSCLKVYMPKKPHKWGFEMWEDPIQMVSFMILIYANQFQIIWYQTLAARQALWRR